MILVCAWFGLFCLGLVLCCFEIILLDIIDLWALNACFLVCDFGLRFDFRIWLLFDCARSWLWVCLFVYCFVKFTLLFYRFAFNCFVFVIAGYFDFDLLCIYFDFLALFGLLAICLDFLLWWLLLCFGLTCWFLLLLVLVCLWVFWFYVCLFVGTCFDWWVLEFLFCALRVGLVLRLFLWLITLIWDMLLVLLLPWSF